MKARATRASPAPGSRTRLPQNLRRGVAWALAAAIFASAFLIPWKLASSHGSPSAAVFVLLLSAALFNTALTPLLARGRTKRRRVRTEAAVSLVLAALTLLGNLASAAAVQHLSAPVLSVLQRTELLVVTLTAWLWLGERVDARFWVGTGLALSGLLLVQGFRAEDLLQLRGVLLGVASAVCFALMSVVVRRNIEHIDPAFVNGARLWMSVLLWFLMNGAPPSLAELDPALVGFAALAAVFGPSLSRLCLMYSARHIEARITSLTTLLVPVFTLGLAFVIFRELPTPRETLGGLLMLGGIALPVFTRARN